MKTIRLILIPGLFTLLVASCRKEREEQASTLFLKVFADQSGIDFSNRITETGEFNILRFEYIYNGGGTSVGDFNNDGLQDLFFTGNMVNNELYLNQGNFRFEKVSAEAGVEGPGKWCSGSAVVDINNDGLLDIYVCATTYDQADLRANLLFVNQGVNGDHIPVFREMAEAYGIADTTHSSNAAFFDYDNDGDLDLFIAVNNMDKRLHPNAYREKGDIRLTYNADKLYENRFDSGKSHPVFRDVSKKAGLLTGGFALGLNIVDINRDGWKDIYVSNDYLSRDLLYINNGNKTFTDRASDYLKHTCYSAMGMNIGDVNSDGLADIFVLDMCPEYNGRRKSMLNANDYNSYLNNEQFGYPYQYVRNMLQLNQGVRPDNGQLAFSEIGLYARIFATDWSWTPLIADFDQDGFMDFIITNGFPKDITDHDFADFMMIRRNYIPDEMSLPRIPSVKLHNYAFRNELNVPGGIPTFENVSGQWGIKEPSFSNGGVSVDLDNDGDLDFVVNNIDDSAFVYRNTVVEKQTKNSNWLQVDFKGNNENVNGLGAIVEIYHNGTEQMWENSPYRGYRSTVQMGAHFGLGETGQLDSIRIEWPGGSGQVLYNVSANQDLMVYQKDATASSPLLPVKNELIFQDITEASGIDFIHPEYDYIDFNVQRLLLHKLSQYGPGIAVSDMNGDGLDDFYVSGSHFHKGRFFVQRRGGQFSEMDLLPGKDDETKLEEELGVLFFDADNDGDEDLYLVSGGYELDISSPFYQDRLFLNDRGRFIQARDALPKFASSGSCVRAADFDRDGDLDLFVAGRVKPAFYPMPVSSYLLVNDGHGNFTDGTDTYAPLLEDIGLISDALWTDYDNDGWVDLLLAGEWMPLTLVKNNSGKYDMKKTIGNGMAIGWWNSLASGDFDLDGDVDYVAGNLGRNSLIRASTQHPVSLYVGDYDNNQSLDLIPTTYFRSENGAMLEYPYFGRNDMEKQMGQIKNIFKEHREYGAVTIDGLMALLPDVTKLLLKANYQPTSYIENLGNGEFRVKELPVEAQMAPVYAMVTGDFTNDQLPDILLTGNDYGNEVGSGRYDALNGLLLAGDGTGNFKPVPMQRSGIVIAGDGKSLVTLQSTENSLVVVSGQNRGRLQLYKLENHVRSIGLEPYDRVAIVHLADNRSYREELYYGNSFLSQSSRRLWFPDQARMIEVIDYKGNTREINIHD